MWHATNLTKRLLANKYFLFKKIEIVTFTKLKCFKNFMKHKRLGDVIL